MAKKPTKISSNDKKPEWDRLRPFQRIGSPSYFPGKKRLTGNSHRQGTRRPYEFPDRNLLESLVTRRLISMIPQWVPTEGENPKFKETKKNQKDMEKNVDQEIYGRLARSFQTWTDAPPRQYHVWYDWNFHLLPEEPFRWLSSEGNLKHPIDHVPLEEDEKESDWSYQRKVKKHKETIKDCKYVVPSYAIELEWDTGGFGKTKPQPGQHRGIRCSDKSPRSSGKANKCAGPMFETDWCWPQTGDFVWGAGRSIYDGGHESHDKVPKSRSELHPLKAVATARFEGFHFKENKKATPAIQFMFFANKFGGYMDYDDLTCRNKKPYEFIVDLPEAPCEEGPPEVEVGSTRGKPKTSVNTVVLRPKLLKHFETPRFSNAADKSAVFPPTGRKLLGLYEGPLKPKVELLPPPDTSKPLLRQAKITIPDELLKKGDSYGVIISLGWRDFSGEQAKKVKKCTFSFKQLKRDASFNHETSKEEWRLKACVNGRWHQWEFEGVSKRDSRDLSDKKWTIYLHEYDSLKITANGAEVDCTDDVYFWDEKDRAFEIKYADVKKEADAEFVARKWAGNPPSRAEWTKLIRWWKRGRKQVGKYARWEDIDVRPPRKEHDIKPYIKEKEKYRGGDTSQLTSDREVKVRRAARAAQYLMQYPVQRVLVRDALGKMWRTYYDQNEPIGMIDPAIGPGSTEEDGEAEKLYKTYLPKAEHKSNPLKIGSKNRTVEGTLTAFKTWEIEGLAELVQVTPDTPRAKESADYQLTYEVKIEDQD